MSEKEKQKKQIEEMARLICLSYNTDACKICDDSDFCSVKDEAQRLYTAGYRKVFDVAWEIFEEIEKVIEKNRYKSYLLNSCLWSWSYRISEIIGGIAELKKKYTEERSENGT